MTKQFINLLKINHNYLNIFINIIIIKNLYKNKINKKNKNIISILKEQILKLLSKNKN